jgi:hypothetical protein
MCLICKGVDISSLQTLTCNDCPNLKKIPELPQGLRTLMCWRCPNLESLPELPEGLQWLECISIGLKSLPVLPRDLEVFICRSCPNLTEIPELPVDLNAFDCHDCESLEKLPQLFYQEPFFYCFNCPLLLSDDPAVLKQINLEENKERHRKKKELIERLNNNERGVWTMMCLGLQDLNSPLKYACPDVVCLIHKYHKPYVLEEYENTLKEILH